MLMIVLFLCKKYRSLSLNFTNPIYMCIQLRNRMRWIHPVLYVLLPEDGFIFATSVFCEDLLPRLHSLSPQFHANFRQFWQHKIPNFNAYILFYFTSPGTEINVLISLALNRGCNTSIILTESTTAKNLYKF